MIQYYNHRQPFFSVVVVFHFLFKIVVSLVFLNKISITILKAMVISLNWDIKVRITVHKHFYLSCYECHNILVSDNLYSLIIITAWHIDDNVMHFIIITGSSISYPILFGGVNISYSSYTLVNIVHIVISTCVNWNQTELKKRLHALPSRTKITRPILTT